MTNQVLNEAEKSGFILSTTRKNCEQVMSLGRIPHWAKNSIEELIQGEKWTELNDRFYKHLTFGTGGMRGRTIGKTITAQEQGERSPKETPRHAAIGTNTLNEITILKASKALFQYTKEYISSLGILEQPRLVVAHDVRHFSVEFSRLVALAWQKLGGYAMIFDGPRSTPQLSFTVRNRYAHAGVVITASHNPYHDNGFKAYFSDGSQLVPPHANKVVEYFDKISIEDILSWIEDEVDLDQFMLLSSQDDQSYAATLEEAVLSHDTLKDHSPKIVFSSIHGTGSISTVPCLMDHGGDVQVVKSQDNFDPNFSSVESPNPENKEALSAAIQQGKKSKADAVIGSDPDCDRIGVAVRKENDFVEYPSSSTPLAIVKHKDEKVYKLDTFKLDGGRIYCFTDGFSECMDENKNEIGIDGVKKLLLHHQNSSLQKELENSAEEIRLKSLKKDYKETGIKDNNDILDDDLTIIGIGN